jgi:hypothetical protein
MRPDFHELKKSAYPTSGEKASEQHLRHRYVRKNNPMYGLQL